MDIEIPELTQEQKNLVLEEIQRSKSTTHQHDLYTNLDEYLNFQKFKNKVKVNINKQFTSPSTCTENIMKNLYNKTVEKLNKYIKNNKQV